MSGSLISSCQCSFWARDSNWQPSSYWTSHLFSAVPTAQVAHLNMRRKSQTCYFFHSQRKCLLFMVMTEMTQRSASTFLPNQIFLSGLWQLDSETKAKRSTGDKNRSWKSNETWPNDVSNWAERIDWLQNAWTVLVKINSESGRFGSRKIWAVSIMQRINFHGIRPTSLFSHALFSHWYRWV